MEHLGGILGRVTTPSSSTEGETWQEAQERHRREEVEAAREALAHWNCADCPARRTRVVRDDEYYPGMPAYARPDDIADVAAGACEFPTIWVSDDGNERVRYGPCEEMRMRLETVKEDRIWSRAGIPARLKLCSFDGFEASTDVRKKAKVACEELVRAYAETGKSDGICLTGQVGRGKTHLAIATARAVVHKACFGGGVGSAVAYLNVPLALEARREQFGKPERERDTASAQIWERAATVGLCILDDLGCERPTEWAIEQLYTVVEARSGNGLTTIVTTNGTPDELADRVGDRIVSRLVEMCRWVTIDGPDYRFERRRKASANG